ncbi:hypothetical protein [Legionella spiritensis]|uniref:Bile acid beta-glucosidase n=1 Tax=Legionella spiritensis TaxID=452 RepID=A0A0W0YY44_LEGSP|nr:hypothetical protein [Legionella spiritensis]KTD61752.1 bile acid beta-glucosidase [Legionella spiritensis]SNV38603.1 bile acid beta-glucosidase [Legionella spiritensis]
MKFKKSETERKLNDYWNKQIVVLDEAIRSASLNLGFFAGLNQAGGLIEKYMQTARIFLSELDCQSDQFEDKLYIRNYRDGAIKQIVDDLTLYSGLVKYEDLAAQFLEAIGEQTLKYPDTVFH